MLDRSIFHLHVPKTAGTTLRLVVEDNLGAAEWQDAIIDRELVGLLIGRAAPPRLDRYTFLSGHLPLSLRAMLKPPVLTVCTIRDPVDLVLSYVAYQRAQGLIPADVSIDDFLDSEAAVTIVNLQARFIAGQAFPAFPTDLSRYRTRATAGQRRAMQAEHGSDTLHRAAMANAATIDAVVDMADFDRGVRGFCAGLGWNTPPVLPRRNAADGAAATAGTATRRAIEAMCRIDRDLYNELCRRTAPPGDRPNIPVRTGDAATPYRIGFGQSFSGTGWQMREFVAEWGWTRWSTERSILHANLRLRAASRYTICIVALDCLDPSRLQEISIEAGGMVLCPRFIRQDTIWRGYADIPASAEDRIIDDIALCVPGAGRPCDFGRGTDSRLLGLRVHAIIIAATADNAIRLD